MASAGAGVRRFAGAANSHAPCRLSASSALASGEPDIDMPFRVPLENNRSTSGGGWGALADLPPRYRAQVDDFVRWVLVLSVRASGNPRCVKSSGCPTAFDACWLSGILAETFFSF